MRCKHEKSISKCDSCLSRLFKHLVKCAKPKCYANAFILLSNSSTTVVRTFTQEEITDQNQCLSVPLTTVCSGSSLQLSSCESPEDKWCKIIDQANGYITSLQVPKCCGGCYNFDLSASVALTSTFSFTAIFIGGDARTFTYDINLPVKASLKLSEQLPRDICVADEVSDSPESCFTSVTFPIIDTPIASATLGYSNFLPNTEDIAFLFSTNLPVIQSILNQTPTFVNLAVSGAVCLKGCQRLVPTLTISPFDISSIFDIITSLIGIIFLGQPFTLEVTLTNTKLQLSDLSLKLVKIGECTEDCDCKKRDFR